VGGAVDTELAGLVGRGFEERLRKALPQFTSFPTRDTLPRECHVYTWAVGPRFAYFIMLQLHSFESRFTIETGWGTPGTYPLLGDFVSGKVDPQALAPRSAARFRLSSLWVPHEQWWDVSVPMLSRLRPGAVGNAVGKALDDAMVRLLAEGLRALGQAGRAHGMPDLPSGG
jgi:hypothetical protein